MTKTIVLATFMILFVMTPTLAQTRKDACHVYVVDVELARKGSGGDKTFPEFYPVMGEEELTTKTYPLPGSSFIITASVYYTDESMASAGGSNSMLLGIVVAPKAQKEAISAEDNAVSEVTDNDHLDTVRAKRFLRVNGKLFLVGIECRCKAR